MWVCARRPAEMDDPEVDTLQATLAQHVLDARGHRDEADALLRELQACQRRGDVARSLREFDRVLGGGGGGGGGGGNDADALLLHHRHRATSAARRQQQPPMPPRPHSATPSSRRRSTPAVAAAAVQQEPRAQEPAAPMPPSPPQPPSPSPAPAPARAPVPARRSGTPTQPCEAAEELERLCAYEAELQGDVAEAERQLAAEAREQEAAEQRQTQELLALASQRRSRREFSTVPSALAGLQRKHARLERFCRAAETRREALERAAMRQHDGFALRCDAQHQPVDPVAAVVTGSVPLEMLEVVRHLATELHGLFIPHKSLLICVFASICAGYLWVKRTQAALRRNGWGAAVVKAHGGVPQLSFGLSYGDATTLLDNPAPHTCRVVATAVRFERAAQAGEAVLCAAAAAELESFRGSVHDATLFADCVVDGPRPGQDGTRLSFRALRPRPRSVQAHTRASTPIEDTSACLERERMMLEDQHLAVKAPTGVVTIAFTDIQASFQLWETLHEDMVTAHEVHTSILRNLMELHNGYEVKNEGDAFMVAFGDVCDAMEWCMAVQLKLLEANWPGSIVAREQAATQVVDGVLLYHGLRVRMGFTTGEPEAQLDPVTGRMDYFGPMVNLAARISGQGKGGETIIGSAGMAALRQKQALPSQNVHVTGKGTKLLKGISKEETMFQLLPKGLGKRKDVHVAGERKKGAWSSILAGLPRKRKKELDPGRREALLKIEPSAPAIFARARLLQRLVEQRERGFMVLYDAAGLEVAPSGRATIVFSDIQSSAVVWESMPGVMEGVLEGYCRVVRELATEYEGYEVKTEGDCFMMAFTTPHRALEWCVAVQLRMLHGVWPGDLEALYDTQGVVVDGRRLFNGPRVRMGLKSGDLTATPDGLSGRADYSGPVVDTAALVAGRCAGGEILMAREAYTELLKLDECCDGSVFGGVHVQSLGMVPVGGGRTEPLFSVVPLALRARRETWRDMQPRPAQSVADRMGSAVYRGASKSKTTAELESVHHKIVDAVASARATNERPFHTLQSHELTEYFDNVFLAVKSIVLLTKLLLEQGSGGEPVDWDRAVRDTISKLQLAQSSVTVAATNDTRTIMSPQAKLRKISHSIGVLRSSLRGGTLPLPAASSTHESSSGGGGGGSESQSLQMPARTFSPRRSVVGRRRASIMMPAHESPARRFSLSQVASPLALKRRVGAGSDTSPAGPPLPAAVRPSPLEGRRVSEPRKAQTGRRRATTIMSPQARRRPSARKQSVD